MGEETSDGRAEGVQFPRTERYEAPLYLAKYLERQSRGQQTGDVDPDDKTPLLAAVQERRTVDHRSASSLHQRVGRMQQAMSEDNRTKEISAPPSSNEAGGRRYLIRHGRTQGYSTEAGLTPGGTSSTLWSHGQQADVQRRDHRDPSCRHQSVGQTATQIQMGLLDGLAMFEKNIKVFEPAPMLSSKPGRCPDGLKDVTRPVILRHPQGSRERAGDGRMAG
jgi:hypothetical protein